MVRKECECMVFGKKVTFLTFSKQENMDILAVGETKINESFPTAQF